MFTVQVADNYKNKILINCLSKPTIMKNLKSKVFGIIILCIALSSQISHAQGLQLEKKKEEQATTKPTKAVAQRLHHNIGIQVSSVSFSTYSQGGRPTAGFVYKLSYELQKNLALSIRPSISFAPGILLLSPSTRYYEIPISVNLYGGSLEQMSFYVGAGANYVNARVHSWILDCVVVSESTILPHLTLGAQARVGPGHMEFRTALSKGLQLSTVENSDSEKSFSVFTASIGYKLYF